MEYSSTEPRLSAYLHARACRAGTPLAGNFELTARCNFDCKMCYVHLTAEEQRRRGRELTADEWLAIAEEARSRGMLFLLLTGGEPLIRADFRYLLTELKKMGLLVSVNSNGSLIDRDWLEFFRHEPPFRFNITLYGGSDAAYERLCGRTMFGRVTENIRALRELGIGVKLNASMTPYNIGDMEQIYHIAEELGTPMQLATYMFPPIRRDESAVGHNDRFTACEAADYSVRWDRLRLTPEQFQERAGDEAGPDAAVGGRILRGDAGRGRLVPRRTQRVLDQLAGRHDALRHDDAAACLRAGAGLRAGLGGDEGRDGADPTAGRVRGLPTEKCVSRVRRDVRDGDGAL